MDLDVKTLIARMNPICRLALQEAAQLCVSQTNFYVEIEHFLSKLVQVERSDLGEILKAYDIKLASFSAQLTGAIEGFKRGAGRTPWSARKEGASSGGGAPSARRLLILSWANSRGSH